MKKTNEICDCGSGKKYKVCCGKFLPFIGAAIAELWVRLGGLDEEAIANADLKRPIILAEI